MHINKLIALVLFGACQFSCLQILCQKKTDTVIVSSAITDTSKKNLLAQDTEAKKFNPRKATFRSAIIPGWGQAYNKKYWKIPIIYAALGTTGGIFFYNLTIYKLLKQAVIYKSDTIPGNDALIDPRFINLSLESIRTYRNNYRQNIDYSVLFFLIFWGLNVVDATVDAHLKSFDVGNDLGLKIKPGYNYVTHTPGITFLLSLREKRSKALSSVP
ncbi:MAG: DUF5683 domain-containing protein [Ginsengibacter sp.]